MDQRKRSAGRSAGAGTVYAGVPLAERPKQGVYAGGCGSNKLQASEQKYEMQLSFVEAFPELKLTSSTIRKCFHKPEEVKASSEKKTRAGFATGIWVRGGGRRLECATVLQRGPVARRNGG